MGDTSKLSACYQLVGVLFIITQTLAIFTTIFSQIASLIYTSLFTLFQSIFKLALQNPLTLLGWMIGWLLYRWKRELKGELLCALRMLCGWMVCCKICSKRGCENVCCWCEHSYHSKCLSNQYGIVLFNECPICIENEVQTKKQPHEYTKFVLALKRELIVLVVTFLGIGIYYSMGLMIKIDEAE